MEIVYQFIADNIYLLFFLNGLAFFALGMAIALETRRSNMVPMSQDLWLLSVYGLVACVGSWLQMFFVTQHPAPTQDSLVSGHDVLKLLLFILAAMLLLQFSVRIIATRSPRLKGLRVGFWLLTALYAGVLLAVLLRSRASGDYWISSAEVWARYLLYFPALSLASLALLLQRREWSKVGLDRIARDCVCAGAGFGLKAIISGLAAVPVLGPARPAMSSWVVLLQLARSVTIVLVVYFVVRMLRAFEIQRQRKLDKAVAERFEAQEQALQSQRQACDEIKQWSASMANTVHSISLAISQPVPFDDTVRVVLRDTIRLAGLQSGAVFLRYGDEPMLHLAAQHGLPDWVVGRLSEVKVGEGLAGWVAQEAKLLIVDDLATDPRPFVAGSIEPVTFYVGIPLKANGKLVGVMQLSSEERHELTPEQVALLDAAGHQLGCAFEDARLLCQVRSMAALEERLRLSRELHDSLVQVLGYLHLRSKVAQTVLASAKGSQVQGELEEIERVAARAYDDVRDSILGLRVTLSAEQDLMPVLQAYCREFSERHQIEVVLQTDEWKQTVLSPEARIQVLRIIQEALTNSWKHGRPNHVRIVFQRLGDRAHILISDDGRGFDLSQVGGDGQRGLGLQTMRERADSVGGSLNVQSEPGHGTVIQMEIPVEQ